MADIEITRAYRDGDEIVIEGSNFTRTTTVVTIDGELVEFDIGTNGEIRVPGSDGGSLAKVTKGEVTLTASIEGGASGSANEPYKTATPDHTPGDVSEDDVTADVSRRDMSDAANLGADEPAKTPQNPVTEVTPEVRGEHVPAENFREAVHQSPVTRVDEDLGIGPRTPYPTGNPEPERERFFRLNGYYPAETAP